MAGLALHGNLAVHQFDQSLDEGQAEPGASETAGGGGVGLGEGLEQLDSGVRRDADARVMDLEAHRHLLGAWFVGEAGPQDHLAGLGELHRVAHKVEQDLT